MRNQSIIFFREKRENGLFGTSHDFLQGSEKIVHYGEQSGNSIHFPSGTREQVSPSPRPQEPGSASLSNRTTLSGKGLKTNVGMPLGGSIRSKGP